MKVLFLLIILLTAKDSLQIRKIKISSAFVIRSPKTTSNMQKFNEILVLNQSSIPPSPEPFTNRIILFSSTSQIRPFYTISQIRSLSSSNTSIISFTINETKGRASKSLFLLISIIASVIVICFVLVMFLCHSKIKTYIQKRFKKNSSELQLNELNRQLRNEDEQSKSNKIGGIDNEIFSVNTHLTRTDSHMTVIDLEN